MRLTIAIFVLLVVSATSNACSMTHQSQDTTKDAWVKSAPAQDNEVFENVLAARRRGDFDGALAIALRGVDGRSPDDFLLQVAADTCFERAQGDSSQRERWVELGVQYSEQALRANPKDLVNVYNLGMSYLAAGMNLQKPRGCSYYKKSLEILEDLRANPILKGEFGVMNGEKLPLEPYRHKLDDQIQQIRVLASGCSSATKSGEASKAK